MALTICPWKYNKTWVYSITYDEALADLHQFAIPIHEEYGIPGHVEVVVGQLGETRNLGNSSYNGYRHMNADELKDLLARGWGIGNHSWSHELIQPDMADLEIGRAKDVLEAAIDAPVDLYCAPGNNSNMSDHVLKACRKYGYLGAMSLTDALNRPNTPLFWINRTALHEQYYAPFFSEYDPFRNIRHAQAQNGWIIDYCHCPLEKPIHPNKDCSHPQLRKRFETILTEGGDNVWCAVPEEVLFYHQTRRHTQIETISDTQTQKRYRLHLNNLSDRVTCRTLTLHADVPAPWCRSPNVWIDGQSHLAHLIEPRKLQITVTVTDGMELVFQDPSAISQVSP